MVPGSANRPTVAIQPALPRQGDALFVRLSAPATTKPEALWQQKSYPLYRSGQDWLAVLPVPSDTPAGGHTLHLKWDASAEPEEIRRKVEIAPVKFPVQRLRMSPRTEALYRYPGVEKEDAAISGAIRTLSDRRLWKGQWALPTRGRLSTPFGVKRVRNGKAVGRHRGLDIAAPTGTPILAPATGRVALAGSYRKHGKTVVLDHGQGLTSLYIHMSAITVRQGQTILKGARLGRVGSTGVSTGPHLHWAVYAHGEPLEPRFFTGLTRRGIRP